MNNIQKYINELKAEKLKAEADYDKCLKGKKYSFAVQRSGEIWAFNFAITKAELLLVNENEKSSLISQGDGSNSGNAM